MSYAAPVGYAHATFRAPTGANGIYHAFGFYEAPAAQKAATQAAATQTLGSANNAYGARAFLVASAAGTASGGTTGVGRITVTGTSVSSAGVRSAGDSEVLVADSSTLAANQYVQTTKYWIGTVTYTLSQTGDRTAYALTFNYGFAKYFEFVDKYVQLQRFEATGRAGATDTGFNVQLLLHNGTGWTFSAAAFVPGGTVICSMNADYVTEKNITNGIRFGYERYNLTTLINGSLGSQGIVARITTSVNSSVDTMDMRVAWVPYPY